jgi:hypothetical protein
MANQIPSFLSGSKCIIKMGTRTVAFAQNISFSDDMSVVPVGQIGSNDYKSLEPTGYLARGSMTITHYSDHVVNAVNTLRPNSAPTDLFTNSPGSDGNSLMNQEGFSPAHMLLSRDFDIEVYERSLDDANGATPGNTLKVLKTGALIYVIKGARFNNYNISFSPGSLVNESVSFLARGIYDSRAGEVNKD